MKTRILARSAPLLLALAASGHAQQSFQAGDLYLYSTAIFGLSTGNAGIVRIDPVTGAGQVLVGPVNGTTSSYPDLAYDPFQDRLVATFSLDGVNTEVFLVDASGGVQPIGFQNQLATNFAPTGDGRIYLEVKGGVNSDIQYIDPSGAIGQLMDASGTAPFQLDPAFATGFYGMIYDPGTHSLFIATASHWMVCPGGVPAQVSLRRLPLSADGTQVEGAVLCAQVDVDLDGGGERPVGWSRGPYGDLFLVVDTNSNAQQARMLRVDPATLAATPYASNGYYIGAAATNAGVYSNVLGQAVVLDTFADALRVFDPGLVGGGALLPVTGVPMISPGGSSGEHAVMCEIGHVAPHHGFIANLTSLSISSGGTQSLAVDVGPQYAGDVYLVLGSFSGWNPPFPVDSVLVPLRPDAYLTSTVSSANTGHLVNTLGVLNGQGVGAAAITISPGLLPPSLVGTVAYHAAIVVDSSGVPEVVHATNPLPLSLGA